MGTLERRDLGFRRCRCVHCCVSLFLCPTTTRYWAPVRVGAGCPPGGWPDEVVGASRLSSGDPLSGDSVRSWGPLADWSCLTSRGVCSIGRFVRKPSGRLAQCGRGVEPRFKRLVMFEVVWFFLQSWSPASTLISVSACRRVTELGLLHEGHAGGTLVLLSCRNPMIQVSSCPEARTGTTKPQ